MKLANTVSEEIFRISEEKNIPLYVIFELTHRCNLRCIHCYLPHLNPLPLREREEERGRSRELTRIEIKSILDQLVKEGCLHLVFTGGEIFLREDFYEIASYARGKGFDLRILTNGTLINEQTANSISELCPSSVEISLYGAKAVTHDKITRSPGSFQKTIKAIKLLKKKGVSVIIKCPLMKQNISEYEDLWRLSEDLDTVIKFDPILAPSNNGSKRPLTYRITNTDLSKIFQDKRLFNSSLVPSYLRQRRIRLRWKLPVTSNFICSAGKNLCSISPYGDVYPCLQLPIRLGDLRRKSFNEIWHPEKHGLPQIKKMRIAADKQTRYTIDELRKTRIEDITVCCGCSSAGICNRCPGLAYLEDGDFKGPSTIACQVTKIIKNTV